MAMRFKIIAIMVLSAFMALPAAGEEKILQVRGSDTIVNLAQRLAEVYSEKNPDRPVSVTGGGSGTGMAGLRNRTIDIANSSRPARQREMIDMRSKGVNPVSVIIAIDCIVLVVNQENRVDKLTIEQLGSIFRGELTNWKELGGDDMPITLYGRQSNSGTYEVFKENVVNSEYSDKVRQMSGNSQIVESIRGDVSGIGYIGIGFLQHGAGLKTIKVSKNTEEGYIDPENRADVESGKYPLTRPLYQYTDGIPSGAIMDFIRFELSAEGQKIVDEMGFIPITRRYIEENRKSIGI
ncbi:MAG: PstS family phosphate ABC transporter substrate-binding protein [Candidatus Omnitrophica bacterium]|nr:PstS family phosphate ABC transporter substrate-binding protein [Candidatus Omnitrophota bacterium]